ncbi:unnamed protein product, partial [Durusdinium trenchii]
LALSACVAIRAFVPPAQPNAAPALRASAAAVLAASTALPAGAADEYLNYNMTGEFTPFMIIGYFGLTTFLTAFAFGSLALSACVAIRAFVPPAQPNAAPALRASAAAVLAASTALPAGAADEYLNYNMTGEFTPFMIIGYFGLTTFLTAFAFGSYLILTKLKII